LFAESFTGKTAFLLFGLPIGGFLPGWILIDPSFPRLFAAAAGALVGFFVAVGIHNALEHPFRRRWDESERRRVQGEERAREERRERGLRSYAGLTKSKWENLLREFNSKCAYCSVPLVPEQTHRDHYVPFSKGGADDVSNIVPACIDCNKVKRDQMPTAWLARCKREKRRINPKLEDWQVGRTE